MQTKFSQTVMVFGCVSYEGDDMPPHFFREGFRLNSDANVELLITVVKPCITRISNGRPYVWQLNSAPAIPLGKVKNGYQRIFTATTVPMFGLRTPQILTHGLLCMGRC